MRTPDGGTQVRVLKFPIAHEIIFGATSRRTRAPIKNSWCASLFAAERILHVTSKRIRCAPCIGNFAMHPPSRSSTTRGKRRLSQGRLAETRWRFHPLRRTNRQNAVTLPPITRLTSVVDIPDFLVFSLKKFLRQLLSILLRPAFDPPRSDARFKELMRRIGLPA